jgi:hypothetical protein
MPGTALARFERLYALGDQRYDNLSDALIQRRLKIKFTCASEALRICPKRRSARATLTRRIHRFGAFLQSGN